MVSMISVLVSIIESKVWWKWEFEIENVKYRIYIELSSFGY